jgi:hypothetical protein
MYARCFLIFMNISQNPLNPKAPHMFLEQNKTWRIWHVGFSNHNIDVGPAFFAHHIHRVCSVQRSPRAKSKKQGGIAMMRTIVLDCQTKNAAPCSPDCFAYKTCHAKRHR